MTFWGIRVGAHRLFLLGVRRGRAPEVIAALGAARHACIAETERRIREGDVGQALLVAQSDDLASLRALQETLTALECAAFVSESTSWRTRVWEGLAAPWRGGVREAASRMLTAKTRALLISIAVFLALLASVVGLSSLVSHDPRRGSSSPMERLTETRSGARAPGRGADGPERSSTEAQRASNGGGRATGARDDDVSDPTATPLEIGAFFAGLFVSLALGSFAARRLRAPGRATARAAQAVGLVLLGVGLWAGTRPREVIRVAGAARDSAGGLTLAAGGGSINGRDDDPDASDADGDGGVAGGASSSRPLRGPFDRFMRSIAIHTSGTPAPTFASLMESLRATPPPTRDAPATERASNDHGAEGDSNDSNDSNDANDANPASEARASARDAPATAHDARHHRGGHRGHGSRHERRRASASARTSGDAGVRAGSDGDAGARVGADASVTAARVTVTARSSGTTATTATDHARAGRGAGAESTASRAQGAPSPRQPSQRLPERSTVDVVRERPRLGPWFLVGLVVGAMLSRRPRREAEATS